MTPIPTRHVKSIFKFQITVWFVPPDALDSEKIYDVGIKSIPYIAGDEMLWLRSKKTAGENCYL